MSRRPEPKQFFPDEIFDRFKNRYTKGKFLGKGGFARCYEAIDKENHVYALKGVSKDKLNQGSNRDKMVQEIAIHKLVDHKNIVKLILCAEDVHNVYMLLELCPNRSMMEMQKRRDHVTEPEARYYMKEIVVGIEYLHSKLIIHRDLKLGNIFLDQGMHVKIGDFGLATQLRNRDERKETVCGTPNYIAPEMLQRQKHSFEVDIWALGCILYTLLVGHPPFETSNIQSTYTKIRTNSYRLPNAVGVDATVLIRELLHADYRKRPNIRKVFDFNFWKGYCPDNLPVSCLTTVPRINEKLVCGGIYALPKEEYTYAKVDVPSMIRPPCPQDAMSMVLTSRKTDQRVAKAQCIVLHHHLRNMLRKMQMRAPGDTGVDILGKTPDVESETPRFTPHYFITRWVDYSDKYGLGYQLADNSYGVDFNDGSKIILDSAQQNVIFIEKEGDENYFKLSNVPERYAKKVQLLNHFRDYMREQLVEAGNTSAELGAELARPPLLNYWYRLEPAIVCQLTNGIVQVNFFNDHVKMIFCPILSAVTLIGKDRSLHTYPFSLLATTCSPDLAQRLQYCAGLVDRLTNYYKIPSFTFEEAVDIVKS